MPPAQQLACEMIRVQSAQETLHPFAQMQGLTRYEMACRLSILLRGKNPLKVN